MTKVFVFSKIHPITEISKKRVEIKTYNKIESTLLSDEFEFVCASIKARIKWEKFEKFELKFFEVGNKYATDTYNKGLIESGPQLLLIQEYQYDFNDGKFKRLTSRARGQKEEAKRIPTFCRPK